MHITVEGEVSCLVKVLLMMQKPASQTILKRHSATIDSVFIIHEGWVIGHFEY
jgi:hypothetical protein